MTISESSKCCTLDSPFLGPANNKKNKNWRRNKNKQDREANAEEANNDGPCKSLIPSLEWQKKKIEDFKSVRKFLELQPSKKPYVSKIMRDEILAKVATGPPKLSEIILYNSIAKITLLNVIRDRLPQIVKSTSTTNNWGAWSYAIMLSIQEPLHRDTHCALRRMAKECLRIRSTLPEDAVKETYVPLNLVICIVARVFGQLDLADDLQKNEVL